MSTEKNQQEAEARLAKLAPEDRMLVEWVMANYGHTLAEALEELSAFGGL